MKDTYTREGQRAMQDTIGQVSARTGGIASSYATSAGNQAYNYMMQQLGDKIPQLNSRTIRAFRTRKGDLYNQFGMFNSLEDKDYFLFRG